MVNGIMSVANVGLYPEERLEMLVQEGFTLDTSNATLAYTNRLNDNQLLTWLDNLISDTNFSLLLAQAKIAVVNWAKFKFQKPNLIAELKPVFEEFGLQPNKARKVSQVIWFLQQQVVASNKPMWASKLACKFKRSHLGEFASLFWAIKDKSRDLGMQICDFIWHRSWDGYDLETNGNLEFLSKQITTFKLPEENLKDLAPIEFAKLPEIAAMLLNRSLKESWNLIKKQSNGLPDLDEGFTELDQFNHMLANVDEIMPEFQMAAKLICNLAIKAYHNWYENL